MSKEIEHEGTQEIVCPYCGYEHSDSWEYPNEEFETECCECGKNINVCRVVDVTYSTHKEKCKECNPVFGGAFISSKRSDFTHIHANLCTEKAEDLFWFVTNRCAKCDDVTYGKGQFLTEEEVAKLKEEGIYSVKYKEQS